VSERVARNAFAAQTACSALVVAPVQSVVPLPPPDDDEVVVVAELPPEPLVEEVSSSEHPAKRAPSVKAIKESFILFRIFNPRSSEATAPSATVALGGPFLDQHSAFVPPVAALYAKRTGVRSRMLENRTPSVSPVRWIQRDDEEQNEWEMSIRDGAARRTQCDFTYASYAAPPD
jgi:hypothetical protein